MRIGGGDNSITETNHIIIPVLHGYCASAIKAVGRGSSPLEFFPGTNLEINFYKPRRPVYKHIRKTLFNMCECVASISRCFTTMYVYHNSIIIKVYGG